MITYTIGGGGGAICRGIPSLDVAIALLRDMVSAEKELEVTFGHIEGRADRFWHAADRNGRTVMVISEEPRCAHCHQIIRNGC